MKLAVSLHAEPAMRGDLSLLLFRVLLHSMEISCGLLVHGFQALLHAFAISLQLLY
jgi:hypothetical protein